MPMSQTHHLHRQKRPKVRVSGVCEEGELIMPRGLDRQFLTLMRKKLDAGRRHGYVGWDRYWENCAFASSPRGPHGLLFQRLQEEIIELALALSREDTEAIGEECADVANFAMMIADLHGALGGVKKGGG